MNIRIAQAADLSRIVEIYNQAIPSMRSTADLSPLKAEDRMAWFAEHSPAKYPIFVAEIDGEVVGWCSLSAYRPGRMALRFTAEVSCYILVLPTLMAKNAVTCTSVSASPIRQLQKLQADTQPFLQIMQTPASDVGSVSGAPTFQPGPPLIPGPIVVSRVVAVIQAMLVSGSARGGIARFRIGIIHAASLPAGLLLRPGGNSSR